MILIYRLNEKEKLKQFVSSNIFDFATVYTRADSLVAISNVFKLDNFVATNDIFNRL